MNRKTKVNDILNSALGLTKRNKRGSRAFSPEVADYFNVPSVSTSYSTKDDNIFSKPISPTVDIANQWKLAASHTYSDGDMILIAIREALQNSCDAIDQARKASQITQGRFVVIWHENTYKDTVDLIIQDNGIGMSADDIENRFLKLAGDGGKTQGSRGGFGYAKASILSLSNDFNFILRTRDLFYHSLNFSGKHDVKNYTTLPNGQKERLPFVQGTKLVLKDINLTYLSNRTNLVLSDDLKLPAYYDKEKHELSRIVQFLSLNAVDSNLYEISFYTKKDDNELQLLYTNKEHELDPSNRFDTFLSSSFMLSQYRLYKQSQVILPRNENGTIEGIGLKRVSLIGKDNIESVASPYKITLGSDIFPIGCKSVIIDGSPFQPDGNAFQPSTFIYVVIAIRGQVQFVYLHHIQLRGANTIIPLLYVNLYTTVKAMDINYPLDLARLNLKSDIKEHIEKLVDAIAKSTETLRDIYDTKWYTTFPYDLKVKISNFVDVSQPMTKGNHFLSIYGKFVEHLDVGTEISYKCDNYRYNILQELKQYTPQYSFLIVDFNNNSFSSLEHIFPTLSFLFKWRKNFIGDSNTSEELKTITDKLFLCFLSTVYVTSTSDDERVQVLRERSNDIDLTNILSASNESEQKMFFSLFTPIYNTFYNDVPAELYGIFLYLILVDALLYDIVFELDPEDDSDSRYTSAYFLLSYSLVRRFLYQQQFFLTTDFYRNSVGQDNWEIDINMRKIIHPSIFIQHVLFQKNICNIMSYDFNEDVQSDQNFFCNPLFGIAFMQCDFDEDYSLIDEMSITCFTIWEIGLRLALEILSVTEFKGIYQERQSYVGICFPKKNADGWTIAFNRTTAFEYNVNYYVINSEFYKELKYKTQDPEKIAIFFLRVIAHELAHTKYQAHDEQFIIHELSLFNALILANASVILATVIPKIDKTIKPSRGSANQIFKRQQQYIKPTVGFATRFCTSKECNHKNKRHRS